MDADGFIRDIKYVTKDWCKQRKREEREQNSAARRRQALKRSARVTLVDAAFEVMESAYMTASRDGTLPARPRQVFYRARGPIQERTGQLVEGQYFSQTLLTKYIAENPETTASWDIVWDDRGHFTEPHTGRIIGLGTLAVREYLGRAAGDVCLSIGLTSVSFPTRGPRNRFQGILFIEKEGFLPLFEAVGLAERFDIAIMSSKGLSTTAARTLIDHLCGENDIPVLVLHDFDKSGFSIIGTLRRNTPRFTFKNCVRVIDLGLRLNDVREHQLESEPVKYRAGGGGAYDPAPNLRKNGATEAEIEFLCCRERWNAYAGQRVELNAFTSDALVAWIETKLEQNGIRKLVPEATTLERAYRRAAAIGKLTELLPGLLEKETKSASIPANLTKRVQNLLRENPAMPWDIAVADLAQRNTGRTGNADS
jgi:hypothetical protein